MEKACQDYDLIPFDYLWGAQCHFCSNTNYPINPKKEILVRYMEKKKPNWYVCDECIAKRINRNSMEVANMKNSEEEG